MSAPTILPMSFTWTDLGELTMKKRDHYTRDAITRDFNKAIKSLKAEGVPVKTIILESAGAKKKHVRVDPKGHWFVTPVADYRYSVVWHCDQNRSKGFIDAVVPAYFAAEKEGELLEQVREVVKAESGQDLIEL
jgi:hypothetical protein